MREKHGTWYARRAQADWAHAEAERLADAQRARHRQQLNEITGGQDVEEFIAERQSMAVLELQRIQEAVAALVASAPPAQRTWRTLIRAAVIRLVAWAATRIAL